ncbi:MAG: hypothetical protein QOE61_215, partial [Micromonosporaceae bacterium]|nr:hypothetical protein [Micromonosporaceae bacterium]
CVAVDATGKVIVGQWSGPLPPTNTAPPSVSGTAVQGQTLTATPGGWAGSPTSFSHQWQDCDSSGAACVAIPGATGLTHVLSASDAGHTLRVVESASNAGGTGPPANSAPTAVVLPLPPASTTRPAISGQVTEGQVLTEVHGGWTGSPTAFVYQWQDCNGSGGACVAIAGASVQTYTLKSSDVGHTIRVQESATNAGGTGGPVTSSATNVVQATAAGTPPANSSPPAVTGTAKIGQNLSASTGAWSGSSPLSYVYQWQLCRSACANVVGATNASFLLSAATTGAHVRVVVTASNPAGHASAASRRVGPVAATPVLALLLRQLRPTGHAAKVRALLTNGGYTFSFRELAAGRVRISWYLVPTGAPLTKGKVNPLLVATGHAKLTHAGRTKVTIKLTTRGTSALKHGTGRKLTAKGAFTPRGKKTVTAIRMFTLAP